MEVTIVGGGIGGLTLALMLHEAGIGSRVYEAAPELKALGVGVNLLPHATRELCRLGLEQPLAAVAITTRESGFYNRFGQYIYSEPTGRHAGYDWPQFSIHRGDLHQVLLDAFRQRVGADRLHLGWRCTGFAQDKDGVDLTFAGQPRVRAEIAVSCEGIHSTIRKQIYPDEGPPRYSGINMWRGVTRAKPFLTGASMVRIGWLQPAKVLVYPIRDAIDAEGRQLINWVVDIETPQYKPQRDWNRRGRLEDFMHAVRDWHFDWLDVPALLEAADMILEYPMVDQDPLERWTFGRLTLLGDAAHPMYPRGANGAAQSILDCRSLADCLKSERDPQVALGQYERARLPATAKVVLTNRQNPPDAILREVYLRTGDKPFRDIDEVISREELAALTHGYARVA
ncbi:MAG TPA: flavin-dependent oxidoreductase, partial [Burkholderiales bacterium]|nr:flavin-dependent oxidoreductase [Burkholderiales bacterium]